MIVITLNVKNLNDSLQVGDMIYATPTAIQTGAEDFEHAGGSVGQAKMVGVLLDIKFLPNGNVALSIAEDGRSYEPSAGDFIMFSKYSQQDGDVNGYYAKANFVNNSKEKAELFAVSSEIIINSK